MGDQGQSVTKMVPREHMPMADGSGAGRRPPGFTLIELLVVVAIIAPADRDSVAGVAQRSRGGQVGSLRRQPAATGFWYSCLRHGVSGLHSSRSGSGTSVRTSRAATSRPTNCGLGPGPYDPPAEPAPVPGAGAAAGDDMSGSACSVLPRRRQLQPRAQRAAHRHGSERLRLIRLSPT